MSGGYLNCPKYIIEEFAGEIDGMIESNDDETLNEYGERRGNGYTPEILEKFREASHTLRQAAEMAQRVDYLLSGDYGPESFIQRWKIDVRQHWESVEISRDL